MYELPSLENVSKVVVDESVIEHKTEPYLIYQTPPARAQGRLRRLTAVTAVASCERPLFRLSA